MHGSAALTAQVRARMDADEELDVEAGLLVLGALEGDVALDRALSEDAADSELPSTAETDAVQAPAKRAYLDKISVRGFRGIGSGCDLGLIPGPGLTLVVGRNGSGKSSFAEALELLLTGKNQRWEGRSAVWKEGWRNLHWSGPAEIAATFAVEGRRQPLTARRVWVEGADLDAGTDEVDGVQEDNSRAALGWDEEIATYRPFLPYNELGSIPDYRPTELYDMMSAALGLDTLVDARQRLRQLRLEHERQVRTAEAARREWFSRVELDDERARACARAIGKPKAGTWDLDAVELVLEGALEPEGEGVIALLRRLATLAVPGAEEARAGAGRLRAAVEGAKAAERTDAGRARQVADLLDRSLVVHAAHGDQPCPVCGAGELTDEWRSRTEAEVQRLRTEAGTADQAQKMLAKARREAQALLVEPLEILGRASDTASVDATALQEAWGRWAGLREAADDSLIEHLEEEHHNLAAAADSLKEQAAAELGRLEEAWRPLVDTLRSWLPTARDAARASRVVPHLRRAEKWLNSETDLIRTERFGPIAKRASEVWETLKQNSSVTLDHLKLEGSATQRHLVLDVSVDGTDGQALGVMSQGEIHALALSLFLPRVLLPESPFGFVVIDDPVQAMDPGKVDGLARVLALVAEERQVLVFTHDERLPESVRRLQIPAQMVEVTRQSGSQVACRTVGDPVAQYLADARALRKTDELPPEAAARALPSFCRLAIEAACTEVVRRRRIGRGEPHSDTDEVLNDARTLMQKLALALFDDSGRGGEVLARLNRSDPRWADAVQWTNRGAHRAVVSQDLSSMVGSTESLTRRLGKLSSNP